MASSSSFEVWLTSALNAAGIDGEVFSSYISGTLSSLEDAAASEVEESLLEILQGCLEDETVCSSVCKDIQKEWQEQVKRKKAAKLAEQISEKERLATMAEEVAKVDTSSSKVKEDSVLSKMTLTGEEKKRLLAQYDCESEEEEDSASHFEEARRGNQTVGTSVHLNSNVANEAQKLHRERLKAEHEVKVERDRKEREAQKQRVQDRKEKEKKRTQKQEKRR